MRADTKQALTHQEAIKLAQASFNLTDNASIAEINFEREHLKQVDGFINLPPDKLKGLIERAQARPDCPVVAKWRSSPDLYEIGKQPLGEPKSSGIRSWLSNLGKNYDWRGFAALCQSSPSLEKLRTFAADRDLQVLFRWTHFVVGRPLVYTAVTLSGWNPSNDELTISIGKLPKTGEGF